MNLRHAAVAMVIALVLTGCEQKVTSENFDQLEKGMTLTQVEQILGPGHLEEATGTSIGITGMEQSKDTIKNRTYSWEEDHKIITVTIKDGKVASMTKRGF